jgi:hypothetical protein
MLENETAWAEYTSSYIINYFSEGYSVYDLNVDIVVKGQAPGRRRETSVIVTYDQTTEYSTDNELDVTTIETEPFATSLDQARYQIYLEDRSAYYKDVTGVSAVSVPGSETGGNTVDPITAPAPSPEGSSNNVTPIIIGVCTAVGAFLLLGGLYLLYVKRDRGEEEYEEEDVDLAREPYVGGGRGRRGDLETGSRSSRQSRSGSRQGSLQGSRFGDDE